MKFKILFSLILNLILLESTQAENLKALIRPLAETELSQINYPVHKLEFVGKFTEAYIYQDIWLSKTNTPSQKELISLLSYFDKIVCPRFKELFNIDPLENPNKKLTENKIIILFDQNQLYKGYHSRVLTERYKRDFILLDINENLNSNAFKYRLPHELQHLVRHHFQKDEDDWLNEGLSVFTEFIHNDEFPIKYLESYKNLSGLSLIKSFEKQRNRSIQYFNNFLFIFYLYQHYGGLTLIRDLLRSPKIGASNINDALFRIKPKNDLNSEYYSFRKAFINYQLALALNPYRKIIKSDGFFDLQLDQVDVPSPFINYSVQSDDLPINSSLILQPMSSNYYHLDRSCFSIDEESSNAAVVVLLDMNASEESKVLQIVQNHKNYCVKKNQSERQQLIIINPDLENKSVIQIH